MFLMDAKSVVDDAGVFFALNVFSSSSENSEPLATLIIKIVKES